MSSLGLTIAAISFNATSYSSRTVLFDKIVSNDLFGYLDTYVNFWCSLLLSTAGIITNLITAVVFIAQGFKDGVNVSLMSVTLCNEIKCLSGCLNRMYGPLALFSADIATFWRTVTSFNQYTPIFTGYVAYCLMAYISIERLLCVSKPFIVRSLLTPKRTLAIVATISLSTFGVYIIMYFVYELVSAVNNVNNKTVLTVLYNKFYISNEMVIMPYYKSLAILLPTLSFIILCTSSAFTVLRLKQSSRALKSDKGATTSKLTSREKKVTKTLLVVILVNICNLFPRVVFYIGQLIEPEFYVIRKYHNLFMTVAMFMYILDYINATVNLFIFLTMSDSFRKTFLLCLSRQKV